MSESFRYVNFGAGNPVPGWLNLDSSPWFAFPRWLHVVLKPIVPRSTAFTENAYQRFRFVPGAVLPFADASVKAVYCSHVLEHLPSEVIPLLMTEFKRVLEPKGVLRIIVPDLAAAMRTTLTDDSPWSDIRALGTLPEALERSRFRAALEGLFGFPSLHRTMLLPENLETLADVNWTLRQDLGYLESAIEPERLSQVENESRCQHAHIMEFRRK